MTKAEAQRIVRAADLEPKIRKLTRERGRLRRALAPFAVRCDDYERDNETCGRYLDDTPLELEGTGLGLTVGDLRRALKAWRGK